jgi:nucleoside-diphosphate-sugar epimerase
MKALVTGASGYIGRFLCQRLEKDGWEVRKLGRRADGGGYIDIDGMMEEKPDVVFNLGAYYIAEHNGGDVVPLIESNILHGVQLLEKMVNHGVHHLVNIGTNWQFPKPVNLYAATKNAFEAIVSYYHDATPINAVSLYLYDVYGPDDDRPKLFKTLRAAAISGERVRLSPGYQLIDLVYIEDVVGAIMAAIPWTADKSRREAGYAVSSGKPLSIRDVVDTYRRVTGAQFDVTWGGRPYRKREVMVPWSGGNPVPGWNPKVDLEQGIRLMEGL